MLASEIHKTGLFLYYSVMIVDLHTENQGACARSLSLEIKRSLDSQCRILKNIFHITSRKRIKYIQFNFSVESLYILTSLKAVIFDWRVWPERKVSTLPGPHHSRSRVRSAGKKQSFVTRQKPRAGVTAGWWKVPSCPVCVGALTRSSLSRFCGHHPS